MKTSRLIAMVVALLIWMPLKAQKFSIGPEIGYESDRYKSHNKNVSTSNGNGFRIGVNANYNFKDGWFLNAGFAFSHREGAKLKGVSGVGIFPTFVRNVEINKAEYLTLPIVVGYKFTLPHHFGIGLDAGGYISTGIGSGSTQFKLTDQEKNGGSLFHESTFTHYNPESNARDHVTIDASKRIDSGIVIGGRIYYRELCLRAYYQFGLTKTIYDVATPWTCGLSLSYNFEIGK